MKIKNYFKIVVLISMLMVAYVSYADDYYSKKIIKVSPDTETIVDLQLRESTVYVYLKQAELSDQETKEVYYHSDIQGSDIYLETADGERYVCENAPEASNGKCKIDRVPMAVNYTLVVKNWVTGSSEFINVPYAKTVNVNDITQNLEVLFLKVNICDATADDPPPEYCSGDILRAPLYCDTDQKKWVFKDSADCRLSQRKVCHDGDQTVLDGRCLDKQGGAVCMEPDCDEYDQTLCSFSTPTSEKLYDRPYFLPGDKVSIEGENFGDEGGEIRVTGDNDLRLFIADNDTRDDFVWSDTKISFVLPPNATAGEIGVRPKGYEYKKIITSTGDWDYATVSDPSTGTKYKIPVYCKAGQLNIAEFTELVIDGESELNVSVSGG